MPDEYTSTETMGGPPCRRNTDENCDCFNCTRAKESNDE